nr:hypothetical protein [Pectinatus frisingensis]
MFESHGFSIERAPVTKGPVDFIASLNGKTMRIKVRAISQIGSYVFMEKRRFNINDTTLFMAVTYIPRSEDEKILYLVPASEWGQDIYPFKGKDYNKSGQTSEPEWGVSFSQKAKDAMESYRFSKIISNFATD